MALYKPDYEYKAAKKLIDRLDDTVENRLIKYYISKKEDHIEKQYKQLEEYKQFFNQLNKFLPKTNIIG